MTRAHFTSRLVHAVEKLRSIMTILQSSAGRTTDAIQTTVTNSDSRLRSQFPWQRSDREMRHSTVASMRLWVSIWKASDRHRIIIAIFSIIVIWPCLTSQNVSRVCKSVSQSIKCLATTSVADVGYTNRVIESHNSDIQCASESECNYDDNATNRVNDQIWLKLNPVWI